MNCISAVADAAVADATAANAAVADIAVADAARHKQGKFSLCCRALPW